MTSNINYISLIYGLIFFAMSIILLWKTRRAITYPFKNIFWAFTAFSTLKAMSILSELSIEFFSSSDDTKLVNNMLFLAIISTLPIISSAISNIFIFYFGISILTYKTSIRIDYKIFPIILFLVYMTLYFSEILEPHVAERISRYSFGFNGAFLGSIGCFNLYHITKKDSEEKRLLFGPLACSIALLLYSLTEGIITNPIFGIQVELLRMLTAIALFISSFFIAELLKKEQKDRIGFI